MIDKPEKTRVQKLFPNKGMHGNATFLAGLHDNAIEYIEQAPVLALAFGAKRSTRADRLYVASRIGGPISRGERLRNVMRAVGLPYPLRKLKAVALSPSARPIVMGISTIDGSTLSQSIPNTPYQQQTWLRGLARFQVRMRLRSAIIRHDDWRWLVFHSRDGVGSEWENFADFRAAHPLADISKWTWERAQTEITCWHDRLATEKQVENYGGGVRSDTQIDLSDWPDHSECGGYEFFKLATPSMLLEEGRRMSHCVGSYVRDVLNGGTSIFSIRQNMRRIATMQLNGSRIVQITGFANRRVDKDVLKAAREFVDQAA